MEGLSTQTVPGAASIHSCAWTFVAVPELEPQGRIELLVFVAGLERPRHHRVLAVESLHELDEDLFLEALFEKTSVAGAVAPFPPV